MNNSILFRLKRKLHNLTIKKFDDYLEMKSSVYGGIRLSSNHYRIRNRNYYGERKEKDLIKFIDSLDKNSVMWDVGANIGFFSIYAAKRGLKVLAFEPDQMTANIINKNIYLNDLSERVLNIPVALNDETKLSFFNMRDFLPANAYNTFDRNLNEWGNDFRPEFKQGAFGVKGDDLVLDESIIKFKQPNFIKIDVDGNELKVLKGMVGTLSSAQHLCIELGYNHPELKEVLVLLDNLGFEENVDKNLFDDKRHNAGMRNHYFSRAKI